MLAQLSGLIIHLIQNTGYLGIFFLMTLESMLLPIPSEVTMPFAGFLVQQGNLAFWLVVTLGALGNLIGSLIAYALGRFLEESVVISLIRNYGKYILISEHEYLRAVKWFQKYGNGVTFFSRLLPVVRTFISLPAGLSEMNLAKFSLYTFIGSFLWSVLLTWVGFTLGSHWDSIHPFFQKFQLVIVLILFAFAVFYIMKKFDLIRKKK